MLVLLLALQPALASDYSTSRAVLDARRAALAGQLDTDREQVLVEARELVFTAITGELIPAWYGTPWAFYGATETPGQGDIACGYFVSTVLRDAGFEVERVLLAQQASEHIVQTFTPEPAIARFRNRPASEVVAWVEGRGPGLYVVGLDYHVSFLVNDGDGVEMCHSSYLEPGVVLCEDAASSAAFVSGYRVVGKLLDDAMVERWLQGEAFPTRTP